MAGRLDGRIAVVTGGSRGIGEAIASAYAREGARIVVCSRKAPGLEAAAARINAEVPGAVVPMVCHVGHLASLQEFWDRVCADVGTPSILVNNAGTNPYFGPMLGTEWPAWDKTFEVNLKGPFAMSRELITRLGGSPGAIINMTSILGKTAAKMQGVYGMTKAAMISMTKTMAVELAEVGIPVRVNAIAPGFVDTKLSAAIRTDSVLNAMVMARTPMGRVATPDEIAGLAVYLASDESSYVTGQTMFVDGGYSVG